MNPTAAAILARYDSTPDVAAIAEALDVSASYVYSVLREHRPNRKRKVHSKRSDLPSRIMAMHVKGIGAAKIAGKLEISRAYVYRHLPRGLDGALLPPCPVPRRS
jgi:transposase